MSALRVISADLLIPDPDVQLAFTFNERHARKMAAEWRDGSVSVLTVTPAPDGIHYYIIDGRHRHYGGTLAGVTEFRCDVHPGPLNPAQKAKIKDDLDGTRRRVRQLEQFLISVIEGDERDTNIVRIVEQHGYSVGKLKAGAPFDRIESVVTLRRIYCDLGAERFSQVIALATNWIGDAKGNTGQWLGGLALLVRDGYTEAWTPKQEKAIKEAVPALVTRQARGDVGLLGSSGNARYAASIEYAIATRLRKLGKMRSRAVGETVSTAPRKQV